MSDHAFASLTPANSLARLAFSDVYDVLMSNGQKSPADGAPAALHDALNRMAVEPERIFDSEILRLRCKKEKEGSRKPNANDGDTSDSFTTSESFTESDTDIEQHRELGMVWEGRYLLKLFKFPPSRPDLGWTAGKGPLENTLIDLILCTRSFAKRHNINLRNPHAQFNFAKENRSFYIITSRSSSTQLTINGETVTRRPYHLNQHKMKIQFDRLEYDFQWTEFAAVNDFRANRSLYVTKNLHGSSDVIVDMPTPLPTKRVMGKWTLGRALGAGAHGRVFFASDSSGNVVALKVLERTSRNYHSVDEEIEILQKVTDVADKSANGEQILRMTDIVYSDSEKFSSKTFDNVGVVLEPMTPKILTELVESRSIGETKGMTMEAASAFRSALIGVKVMHDEGWLHRDLKPANIGLVGSPPRSVLLDVGTSRHILAGGSLPPEPGTIGTVGYLAPELELEKYDHSIDIWAMAVVMYELTYGYHPWKFAINPWREGRDNEQLRERFEQSYQNAIDKMARDFMSARASPANGFIHLGSLSIKMVKHPWALNNHGQRYNIKEVLQDPAWGSLLPEPLQVKRRRLGLE